MDVDICAEADESNQTNCRPAQLINPSANPFEVDLEANNPQDFVIVRADCDRLSREHRIEVRLRVPDTDTTETTRSLKWAHVCEPPEMARDKSENREAVRP